jgi:hypothetical protein
LSIAARLDDAQVLYEAGRCDGALPSLLVAVAATSRKRYPRSAGMGDHEAFTRFIADEMGNVTDSIGNIRFENLHVEHRRPDPMNLADVLYTYVRCELAHEATMPSDVVFVRDPYLMLKAGPHLLLNEVFLQGLANVVLGAPENAAERGQPVSVGVKVAAGMAALQEPGARIRSVSSVHRSISGGGFCTTRINRLPVPTRRRSRRRDGDQVRKGTYSGRYVNLQFQVRLSEGSAPRGMAPWITHPPRREM